MLMLVTNSVVFRDVWAACYHDEGAHCGCAKVLVFFVAYFLSSVSKCHSKSQSWGGETMSILFVELQTCCAYFALGDCGLFHSDDCCFVSES
jgi:hypothetical protein